MRGGLLAVVAAIVVLVFLKTDWHDVLAAVYRVRLGWLAVSVSIVFFLLFLRAVRWAFFVRPVSPVRFRQLFSATQIGALANFILPVRAGEAVRALALARMANIRFSKTLTMAALDRVTDVAGILAVMTLAALTFTPRDVALPESVFGVPYRATAAEIRSAEFFVISVAVVLIAVFAFFYRYTDVPVKTAERLAGRLPATIASMIRRFSSSCAETILMIRSTSGFAKATILSLAIWAISLLDIAALLKAFSIDFPWYTPLVIQASVAVAIALPALPAYIGQFQVPIVLTLLILVPGMDDATAKAASIVGYLVNLVPVLVAGIFCLLREHMELFALVNAAKVYPQQVTGGEYLSD